MRGVTLLEILLIIGMLAVLMILIPLSLDFYKSQQLETHSQGIIQCLRMAQLKAMSTEADSSFGVYLTDNSYILFKGDSYLERDEQYDEIFEIPAIITLTGLSEIVFLKSEGIPKESPAYCGGICDPCSDFQIPGHCREQDGCSWDSRNSVCQGICTPCGNFLEQNSCQDQSGCSWNLFSGGGNIILNSNDKSRIININEMGRINLEL